MGFDPSIAQLIEAIREGQEEGARELWERYFHRLVALARKQLGEYRPRSANEEDFALSALRTF